MSLDETIKNLDWTESPTARLQKALLSTGLMNGEFVKQITDNEVDEEHVRAALKNFSGAMHPAPKTPLNRYVLGFLFSENGSRVLLVWKNRPAWQDGKLNGVGGKIEDGETPLQAMRREFVEETMFLGYTTTKLDNVPQFKPEWHYVGKRHRVPLFDDQPNSYEMFVYAAWIPDASWADISNRDTSNFPGLITHWDLSTQNDPKKEEVIALPLNREILHRRGVPGLAWTVDIALQSLREHFIFDVEDPADMAFIEDCEIK